MASRYAFVISCDEKKERKLSSKCGFLLIYNIDEEDVDMLLFYQKKKKKKKKKK